MLTGFIVFGVVLIILTAIVNWKLPTKRAKKMSNIAIRIFTVYMAVVIPIMNLAGNFEINSNSFMVLFLAFQLIILLLFTTTVLIPYSKNKADTETLRDTVKQTIIFSITMIALVSLCLVLVVLYIGM